MKSKKQLGELTSLYFSQSLPYSVLTDGGANSF